MPPCKLPSHVFSVGDARVPTTTPHFLNKVANLLPHVRGSRVWALRANGPSHTSLGQRPRSRVGMRFESGESLSEAQPASHRLPAGRAERGKARPMWWRWSGGRLWAATWRAFSHGRMLTRSPFLTKENNLVALVAGTRMHPCDAGWSGT